MGWSKETILTSTEVAAFEFSLAPCRDSGICRVPGLSRRPSHTASSSSGKDIDLYWETVLGGEESGSEGGVGFMASRESCWAIHTMRAQVRTRPRHVEEALTDLYKNYTERSLWRTFGVF